ncbi:AAA family ATPase [Agrobacterium sp.]|uniref:AAA family ATPase n=1 Tax=Agrobacterium sp. TaxID=361 RepID=UPI0028AB279D
MIDWQHFHADDVTTALRAVGDATRNLRRALRNVPNRLHRKRGAEFLEKSPHEFLAYCALIRNLKKQHGFFSEAGGVIVVRVPQSWPLEEFEHLAGLCLGTGKEREALLLSICCHSPRNRKGEWEFRPQSYLSAPKAIIFISKGAELHPEFATAVDWIVDLDVFDGRCIDSLCKFLGNGKLSIEDKEFLTRQSVGLIDSTFRRGRPAARAIERIKQLVVQSNVEKEVLPLTAFGTAGDWGIDLKSDLASWREGILPWDQVDKGILLYGPPGTGKTSFAKSLANECGANFIASSLGQWQSAGHMGDLLKAMYATFAEAKASAPSILLVDEFDSFGHREKLTGDNAQYMLEVINAMLEVLDGAVGREGVIIVAASNLPEKIDTAFLRPGRLEKHVEMPMPNAIARETILTHYLPEFLESAELQSIARRLHGKSGADLEYIARQARKRARRKSRSLQIIDLENEVPIFIPLKPDELWRICLHEAGHAVLAKIFDVGLVTSVEVYTNDHRADMDNDVHGRTMVLTPGASLETENSYRAEIAMKLGGLAAEEVFVGDRSTASGGLEKGDLVSATELAVRMAGIFGMGRMLQVLPVRHLDPKDATLFQKYPFLQNQVDEILEAEFQTARETLKTHQDVVFALAVALKKKRHISGQELEILLSTLPPRDARSAIKRNYDLNELSPA